MQGLYKIKTSHTHKSTRNSPKLILTENSSQFKGKDYLQVHGTVHGYENGSCFRQYFHGEN